MSHSSSDTAMSHSSSHEEIQRDEISASHTSDLSYREVGKLHSEDDFHLSYSTTPEDQKKKKEGKDSLLETVASDLIEAVSSSTSTDGNIMNDIEMEYDAVDNVDKMNLEVDTVAPAHSRDGTVLSGIEMEYDSVDDDDELNLEVDTVAPASSRDGTVLSGIEMEYDSVDDDDELNLEVDTISPASSRDDTILSGIDMEYDAADVVDELNREVDTIAPATKSFVSHSSVTEEPESKQPSGSGSTSATNSVVSHSSVTEESESEQPSSCSSDDQSVFDEQEEETATKMEYESEVHDQPALMVGPMDHRLEPNMGLPPLPTRKQSHYASEGIPSRFPSLADEDQSDCGSTLAHSEAGSQDTDTNEETMPLLKVMERLNKTMERLTQIENESESMIALEASSVPDNITTNTAPAVARSEEDDDGIKARRKFLSDESTDQEEVVSESQKGRQLPNLNIDELLVVEPESIEVDTGDKMMELRSPRGELRSPRGNFGDDFGSDTDMFRGGWTRALQQPDVNAEVRDGPDATGTVSSTVAALHPIVDVNAEMRDGHEATGMVSSKKAALSPIVEEAGSNEGNHIWKKAMTTDTVLSVRVNAFLESHDNAIATKPKANQLTDVTRPMDLQVGWKPNFSISMYERILNCCTPGQVKSPKVEELSLLDDSRDDEY